MKIEGDDVIFSTGTIKRANRGIIGLGHDKTISEGYDGDLHSPKQDWQDDDDYEGLSKDEQIELADYMIKRWEEFKASIN